MDTSHISRIGKYLDNLEEWPCCQPTGQEDFETIPTRLSFKQIVADLPCLLPQELGEQEYSSHDRDFEPLEQRLFGFLESKSCSPRQNKAIDAFQVIHREVLRSSKSHGINIQDVRQFAACFDELLFQGKVLQRCAIHYWDDPPKTHGGECWASHICRKHEQCHAVSIMLARDNFGELAPKQRLDRVLTLLLHEMCHAWVSLYFDTRGMTVEETLQDFGHGGHGLAWTWVMRISILAASHFFGINAKQYEYSHCENDFENDSMIEDRIKALGKEIASASGSPEYIHDRIQSRLEVSRDRASHFFHLLDKGFTIIEALALVKGMGVNVWLIPQMATLVPEDWSYVEHKSLKDWDYWKPEVRKNEDESVLGGWS